MLLGERRSHLLLLENDTEVYERLSSFVLDSLVTQLVNQGSQIFIAERIDETLLRINSIRVVLVQDRSEAVSVGIFQLKSWYDAQNTC